MPRMKPESGLDHLEEKPSSSREELDEVRSLFEEGVFEDADGEPESDEDEEKETPAPSNFDGFGEEEEQEPIPEDKSSASAEIEAELRGMTDEKFQTLVKENPAKALELAVWNTLNKSGLLNSNKQAMMQATRDALTVEDTRRVIGARFRPDVNTKLREKAQEIYKSKKFDVRRNPQAELDAFILAAEQHPDLMTTDGMDVRNEPTSNPRKKNVQVNQTRLTNKDIEIGRKMGVDVTDPRVARRIARVKADYAKRRRS